MPRMNGRRPAESSTRIRSSVRSGSTACFSPLLGSTSRSLPHARSGCEQTGVAAKKWQKWGVFGEASRRSLQKRNDPVAFRVDLRPGGDLRFGSQRNDGGCALSVRSTNDVFQSPWIVEIIGISRRRLQARTDPIVSNVKTPGGYSGAIIKDRVSLKVAKKLINAGVSVQRVRKSTGALRRILPTVRRSLADLALGATGVRDRTA